MKYLCRAEKGGVKYPANCEQPTPGLAVTLNKALGFSNGQWDGTRCIVSQYCCLVSQYCCLGVLCQSIAVLCYSLGALCRSIAVLCSSIAVLCRSIAVLVYCVAVLQDGQVLQCFSFSLLYSETKTCLGTIGFQ